MKHIATQPDRTRKITCHSPAGNDTEKFFEHFFSQKNLFSTIPHTPWSPPTDVYETPDSYVVRLEIPGIEDIAKDVEVELNHNILTIHGYRRDRCTDTKLGFHQMEIHYGYFERVVTLPHAIDPAVEPGKYGNGFLCITIGKASAPSPTRRSINIGS